MPNIRANSAAQIMSSAIDWRHVLTGVVIGFPALLGVAAGFRAVTEYAIGEIKQELTKQEARSELRIDELRQDVRELRTRVDQIQTRGPGP